MEVDRTIQQSDARRAVAHSTQALAASGRLFHVRAEREEPRQFRIGPFGVFGRQRMKEKKQIVFLAYRRHLNESQRAMVATQAGRIRKLSQPMRTISPYSQVIPFPLRGAYWGVIK